STPVVVLMVSPAGAVTRLNVRVFCGRSESVAVLATTNVLNSSIVRSGGTVRAGGVLTSRTTTSKLLVALSGGEPLSVTPTTMRAVPGPCASVGVHLNTPVTGSMVAPAGALGANE